ncbi:MAG: DUF4190 domain-containing protein, partial [Verrucomicrobiales bacterium]|nr:DUF4190 domain-containing protein [Verrucomicrobiales bacterium]
LVGADQKEYGPVTAEQLRQWIKEGRANSQTIVRFEEGPWKRLSAFPEFTDELAQAPSPSLPPALSVGPPSSGGIDGQRNHPLAITGLVLSCLALVPCCCCGPLLSTVAVILCAIALSQISQEPDKWTGKNLAIVGMVLALLSFLAFAGFWLFEGNPIFQDGPFRFR